MPRADLLVLSYLERLPTQLFGRVDVALLHTHLSKCGA